MLAPLYKRIDAGRGAGTGVRRVAGAADRYLNGGRGSRDGQRSANGGRGNQRSPHCTKRQSVPLSWLLGGGFPAPSRRPSPATSRSEHSGRIARLLLAVYCGPKTWLSAQPTLDATLTGRATVRNAGLSSAASLKASMTGTDQPSIGQDRMASADGALSGRAGGGHPPARAERDGRRRGAHRAARAVRSAAERDRRRSLRRGP